MRGQVEGGQYKREMCGAGWEPSTGMESSGEKAGRTEGLDGEGRREDERA